MESLDTETLLRFLSGNLNGQKTLAISRYINEHPHYKDITGGLAILLDQLGSEKAVLEHLNKSQRKNRFFNNLSFLGVLLIV